MTVGIGTALKRLRIEKSLTQKELAAIVSGGVDYTYIGKIERGEQLPSLKILMKLAKALAVPLSSFFREEDERLTALLKPAKVVNLAAAREMSCLLRELDQVQRKDIPLLIEIVRALNGHRKREKREIYSMREGDQALVAEEGPVYDDK